jgi:hypothetical protein
MSKEKVTKRQKDISRLIRDKKNKLKISLSASKKKKQ